MDAIAPLQSPACLGGRACESSMEAPCETISLPEGKPIVLLTIFEPFLASCSHNHL